jgi:predicted NUDIX family NTP pyrophosphohydrolase
MYRRRANEVQVLLVHPGGPFWARKDVGAWSIPKGEPDGEEELLTTAKREFKEEIGIEVSGPFQTLAPVTQKAGKVVHAWAVEGDVDTTKVISNTMRLEWPPKSGRYISVPEIDRAEFLDLGTARMKINQAQVAFIDELERTLAAEES